MRGEFDPLGKSADDQRRRNAGKGHLERDERIFGNVDIVAEGRDDGCGIDTLQENLVKAAHKRCKRTIAARGKGHRISPADPDQGRDRDNHKHLHQQAEHILRADKPAIEKRERRDGHEEHKG
jgi:hypothetical protein